MAFEIEQELRAVAVDGDLQKTLDALAADGWKMAPGVKPLAIYHLFRVRVDGQIVKDAPSMDAPKPAPSFVADVKARLEIDESKIGVIRDGKVLE